MNNKGILSSGLDRVTHNKRYIFWFWVLNLTLGEFGTSSFRNNLHANLDHSLYSKGLLHGFDLAVFAETLSRPQFGDLRSMTSPALFFSLLFLVATVLFLPGVF